jgi:hypothetical protein
MAQIIPQNVNAQLPTICTWFIRKGATDRGPVTTLQRPKEEGGRGFPNICAKCRTLLYNGIQILGEREGTVLAEQISNWELNGTLANPPNVTRISTKLVHTRQYAMDMAYVPPYATEETRKAFKRRTYDVLMHMETVTYNPTNYA